VASGLGIATRNSILSIRPRTGPITWGLPRWRTSLLLDTVNHACVMPPTCGRVNPLGETEGWLAHYPHCARRFGWVSLISLSRFSHLLPFLPQNCPIVAMCVQPNAVARKAIPYMVLYCLTPARFHRYSSLTLCPPYPAWGENVAEACIEPFNERPRGISLVNTRAQAPGTPTPGKTNSNWPDH
jgi:hypothetical protein